MATKQLTDLDFDNASRARNLPAPLLGSDAATMDFVLQQVERLKFKTSVRVATQGNVNLAAPGASVDGVAMSAGDRFLTRANTTASQNGIHVWNGAAVPATRALDANTAAELEAAVVVVEEGTDAGVQYRQTAVNFTLDTDPVTWVAAPSSVPDASTTVAGKVELLTQAELDAGTDTTRVPTADILAAWSGRARKSSALIGDGTATTFNVTHNFNTRDVLVQVMRNSGSFDTVHVDVARTSVNQVTISGFTTAPTANQYRVFVMG